MARIDVSGIVNDPDFTQTFMVKRQKGEWTAGRFVSTETTVRMSGKISPMKPKEITQLPEGDAISAAIVIHSSKPLYQTRLTQEDQTEGALSDEIVWKCERWRVLSVQDYSDYGYYRTIAIRKLGA